MMKGQAMKMRMIVSVFLFMGALPCGAQAAISAATLYGDGFGQCLQELALIAPLDARVHRVREAALNGEIGKATKYLLIRERLSEDVRGTLDRLHEANLNRECRQVHNVLFEQLLNSSATPVLQGAKQP